MDFVKKIPELKDEIASGGIPDANAALLYEDETILSLDKKPLQIITSQKRVDKYHGELVIEVVDEEK